MNAKVSARRLATILLIAALFAPYFMPVHDVAAQAEAKKIVIDMSHGQYNSKLVNAEDGNLTEDLEALGYEVVWAMGGLNDTILSDADGLLIGSIYGDANGFAVTEIEAVADWFNQGNKFLWIGADSDYSGAYINDNMTAILTAVYSHVYPEPTSIEDAYSNCGAGYRPVANGTGTDPVIADAVDGVSAILMHGPTLLYGSTTAEYDNNTVALETTDIDNVYPMLYYGAAATIVDHDLVAPVEHNAGDVGAFVAMTAELYAGEDQTGVLIVSGASPYGDYQPMYSDEYKGVSLNGSLLVIQTIEWGMDLAPTLVPPTAGAPVDMTLIIAGAAVVVVVVIVIALMKRK